MRTQSVETSIRELGNRCAVVIPAHNAADHLAEALESVLEQTAIPCEVIVVDNGSTDDTATVASRFEGVQVLDHPEPKGASSARNAGLRSTSAEFVVFLDADDLCAPGRIERQARQLAEHLDLGLTFCDVEYFGRDSASIYRTVSFPEFDQAGFLGRLFERNRIPTTSAVTARRSAVLAAGGFNEALAYNEEYDLWLRLAAEHPVGYLPEPLVRYRIHPGNISRNEEGQRLNELRALANHSQSTIREAIFKAHGDPVDALLAFSSVLFRMERFEACEKTLGELTQTNRSQTALLHFWRGNLALVGDDVMRAVSEYELALSSDPELLPALNNLGVALARVGLAGEGKAKFTEAFTLNPDYNDSKRNLGVIESGGPPEELKPTLTLLRPVLKPVL